MPMDARTKRWLWICALLLMIVYLQFFSDRRGAVPAHRRFTRYFDGSAQNHRAHGLHWITLEAVLELRKAGMSWAEAAAVQQQRQAAQEMSLAAMDELWKPGMSVPQMVAVHRDQEAAQAIELHGFSVGFRLAEAGEVGLAPSDKEVDAMARRSALELKDPGGPEFKQLWTRGFEKGCRSVRALLLPAETSSAPHPAPPDPAEDVPRLLLPASGPYSGPRR